MIIKIFLIIVQSVKVKVKTICCESSSKVAKSIQACIGQYTILYHTIPRRPGSFRITSVLCTP